MRQHTIIILTLAAALMTFPALALDLQQARRDGQVGEGADGYVAPIARTADVEALVSSINGKRKQEYTRISQQKGQPVDVVGKVAAEQIIQGLAPGAMYQGADGSWKKR